MDAESYIVPFLVFYSELSRYYKICFLLQSHVSKVINDNTDVLNVHLVCSPIEVDGYVPGKSCMSSLWMESSLLFLFFDAHIQIFQFLQ